MPRLYVQAQKFQISGSGISSSATSLNLVSFKITKPDASTRDITMADFGDLGLMVLEPGVARKEETISFTGVTQNVDGSATLTGVTRGITPFSPYGADSSYASAHSGFVTAILSNPAKMYSNFIGPSDNVTVTGLWDFPYPTTATSPATKQYVDDVFTGTVGTATDTTAGSTRMTKNQSTKPRAQSTYVREQNTPDMTLKVESFKLAFIDTLTTFAGGNSPAFINPGFAGDLAIVSNPSNTETVTLTINGTVCTFTFVTSIGAAPGNILIQGTAALTRAALATFIANPGTTNANQVAFTGAQLTALGLISSTDDLSANLFIRATSSTVTTFTGAETMAGGSNTWTANTTKNRLDLLVLNGGSLAIRKGSEAVSPTLPTPTSGDIVLCSVYNIPGETTIKDKSAALSGYIDEWYDLGVYRTDLATSSSLSSIRGVWLGSGADGSYTLDGTQAAVAGLFSKSGSTYTLLRSAFFDTLIINSGVILQTQNFQLFGKTEIRNNGTIQCNGGASTTDIAGTAVPNGTYRQVTNVSNGSYNGASGAGAYGVPAPTASNPSCSGSQGVKAGSNGGNHAVGTGSATGGAVTPTVTNPISNYLNLFDLLQFVSGAYPVAMTTSGGSCGGDGASSTSGPYTCSKGGGAGAVGGTIGIFTKLWSGNGVVEAKGGAGGPGGSGGTYACNGSGGGAGGNGGLVFIFYVTKTYTGTVDVTGGAGGVGGTPATAGTPGGDGATGATGQSIELAL